MAKKAVIIGINDYAPIGSGGPDLNGCIHDARDMANTLVICGFEAKDIRILTNQNATKTNILSYLKWLITTSKKEIHSFFIILDMEQE
ncbi:MAG: caspase family protein [Flavobacterium sp.]|nr:caspase family protein [Flavobacterium sp.]